MADDDKPVGTPPAPAPPLDEKSVLDIIMKAFGIAHSKEAPPKVEPPAPAPKVEAPKVEAPKVEAPAALSEADIAQMRGQVDTAIREAFTRLKIPLEPRTPAPQKPTWPTTQREALEWARDKKKKEDLNRAIDDGMKFHELPRR